VVLLAVTVLTAGFAVLPLVATTVAGALAVVLGWGIAAWGFVPAQQHRLIGLGVGPAPLVLALNSSATHLGFAAGALLGGLVVDAAGAGALWLLAGPLLWCRADVARDPDAGSRGICVTATRGERGTPDPAASAPR
jgi:predicted MFS family arabinose efflux permease